METTHNDIPIEILAVVAVRLPIIPSTDLIRFGTSVCKSWRQAALDVRARRRALMPWLMNLVGYECLANGRVLERFDQLPDFWEANYPVRATLRRADPEGCNLSRPVLRVVTRH